MGLRSVIPTFRVNDARAAEAFYCGKLGFAVTWKHDPGDGYPVFVEVARDDVAIHLSQHEGDGPKAVSVYVAVDDARALWVAFVEAGARPDGEVERMEWGDDVFSVTDADGNVMRFGSAGG